jgi:hypothetical protein
MNMLEAPAVSVPTTISEFDTAVKDCRFVQAFGVVALVFTLLLYLGITLGSLGAFVTGLFIFRYQPRTFYGLLGTLVMLLGIVDPLLIPSVLASFMLAKGMQIIRVLNRSPHDNPGWQKTHARATFGLVAAGIGLAIDLLIQYA